MAYDADDWQINVRGNLTGGEQWSNSWCFHDNDGGQPVQEVADLLSNWYETVWGFASWIHNGTTVEGAVARSLLDGGLTELDFFTGSGGNNVSALPNQLAMRISLSGTGGARGGPFIAGFDRTANDDGMIDDDCIGDIIGALEGLASAVITAGWTWCINRPTTEVTVPVNVGRIGHRWDVIRKRANELAESYTVFDVA